MRRALMLAVLIFFFKGVWAADYVITYTTENTTYYLARNGTSGVQRVTTFDPATCVWSCASNTAGTTAGTLNNSNTYGYLYQTVNGTRYFLNASANTLGLGTNAGANNYYRWRTNGTYVYNRYSNNTLYYINLANGVARNTTANTASNAQPYQVTTSTVAATLTNVSISGDGTLAATGSYNYTLSGTYTSASTNYRFNNTDHYSPAPTTTTVTPTGTWTVSGDGASYVSVNASTGAITVNSLPMDGDKTITLQCVPTYNGTTATAVTKTITLKDGRPIGNPTGITATNIELFAGNRAAGTNYTLTAATGTRPFDWVTAESSNPAIASVTNTNGTFTVTAEDEGTATITITAYNQDKTTVAATTTFTVTVTKIPDSGVSGGVVTLNDREDHSWSYYSDPDCPIRSLNPADVKITYNGNGTNNISTTNGATPAANSWTQSASTVKVSAASGEDQSTFVYYKTLERTDGSTSDNPSGRCAYTAIPNPFSVRPTYQYANGDLNKYCGFYKWRVKTLKGGAIYDAANGGNSIAVGGTIDAEQTIYFAPTSEYGMEVELEALWARAYVTTGSNNMGTYVTGSNAYERNFHVVTNTGQTASNYQKSYPVTISSRYPDGTNGGGSFNAGNFTAAADTKVEFLNIGTSNNYTWTANNHDLIIGRGCSGTVNYVCGINGSNTANLNYKLRIESGKIKNLSFLAGYVGNYDLKYTFSGNDNKINCTLGTDYDRAQSDNEKLEITDYIYFGYMRMNYGMVNQDLSKEVLSVTTKSGSYMTEQASSDAAEAFYIGIGGYGNQNTDTPVNVGRRTLTIEGGHFTHIAGGIDANNDASQNSLTIRMRGGTVTGSIYGAGAFAAASGSRKFVFTGGTINGWIACGANGTTTTQNGDNLGRLPSDTYLYVGGTTKVGTSDATLINTIEGGNVFGAGNGGTYVSGRPNSGEVQNSTVVIADKSDIYRNVFGGGNQGHTRYTADVYILGGTTNGNVYVGSNKNDGTTANLLMTGGLVKGGIYGGSNTTGTISGNVTMQINGGQVGTISQPANIHGGGYGAPTRVSGNVDITLGTTTQTTPGVTVYGDVYGGSALGYVNGTTATDNYHTYVTLNKGTINGSLYGGGLGNSSTAANVYGPVQVKVYGGSVKKTDSNGANGSGGVYGANNVNGAPQRSVTVDIYGTDPAPSENEYALYAVYGGGNAADYTYGNGPTVTVHNCDNSIEYVYGGGNAAAVAANNVTI